MFRSPHLAHATFTDLLDQGVAANLARLLQPHAHTVDDSADEVGGDRAHVIREEEQQIDSINRRVAHDGREHK
jgi:hypothetical protein